MSASQQPPATPSRDPYAVFRPRRGRKVALGVAVAALVIFTVGAISLPQGDPLFGGWTIIDRLALELIGVAIAALMWRFASIRAVPTREGLVVRNLFTTRRLSWAQIIRVQFGGAPPGSPSTSTTPTPLRSWRSRRPTAGSAAPRPAGCPPSCKSTGSARSLAGPDRLNSRGAGVPGHAGAMSWWVRASAAGCAGTASPAGSAPRRERAAPPTPAGSRRWRPAPRPWSWAPTPPRCS